MKKLIVLLLVATIALSMVFAFTACGDNAELLSRIDELERELNSIRELDGIPGTPGADGQPGTSPHIGANGNWWVGTTDTGIRAEGVNGLPGQSPRIVEGYWWVGDTPTGVPARGPQGPPGDGRESTPMPIHNMGDSVYVYSNGYRLIRVTMTHTTVNSAHFDIVNLTTAPIISVDVIAVRYIRPNNTNFLSGSINEFILLPQLTNSWFFSFGGAPVSYAIVGFPSGTNGLTPYAIFRIPS